MKKFLTCIMCFALVLITTVALTACGEETPTPPADTSTHVSTVEQLKNAVDNGGKITLDADITTTATIAVTKEVTINLNNKTITGNFVQQGGTENIGVFRIKDAGNLTIGGGNITSKATITFYAENDDSRLTILDGTYTCAENTIVQVNNKAKALIEGGNFNVEPKTEFGDSKDDDFKTWGRKFTLNKINSAKDTAEITVKGGTFKGYNPGDSSSSDDGEGSFVAAGYKVTTSEQGGVTYYTVVKE